MRQLIMRIALAVLVVALATATAHARPGHKWGGYVSESFGGSSYKGPLAAYGGGGVRGQVGIGVVRGPWAVEWFGAGIDPDFLYIDCYGDECGGPASLTFTIVGLDLRRAWHLWQPTRFRWASLDLVLHGGLRVVEPGGPYKQGNESFEGEHVFGVGGGATIDLNLSVYSMFIDFSSDFFSVDTPSGAGLGRLPTVLMGGRLGWV